MIWKKGGKKTPSQETDEDALSQMGLIDHLDELRKRIIYSLVFFVVGTCGGWYMAPEALKLLSYGQNLQALGPLDPFMMQLKMAMIIGVIVASPMLIMQIWLFISPGLKPSERRFAFPTIFSAIILFFLGGGLGAATVPLTLRVLSQFMKGYVHSDYSLDRFITFVGSYVLGLGIVFEMPVVLVLLAKIGIISYKQLVAGRKYAFVLIVFIAAVITPTGDPITLTVFTVPLYLLFEATLLVIRFIKPTPKEEEPEMEPPEVKDYYSNVEKNNES
jgi:sec-independent protein translocase protein TatC